MALSAFDFPRDPRGATHSNTHPIFTTGVARVLLLLILLLEWTMENAIHGSIYSSKQVIRQRMAEDQGCRKQKLPKHQSPGGCLVASQF